MRLASIMIIAFLFLFGCKRNIQDCHCNEVQIFGSGLGILIPVRIAEKNVRQTGISVIIRDQKEIDQLKKAILELELLPENYEGIDARVVMDFICSNGGKSTVVLNRALIQIGDQYFEPSDKLFDLLPVR